MLHNMAFHSRWDKSNEKGYKTRWLFDEAGLSDRFDCIKSYIFTL